MNKLKYEVKNFILFLSRIWDRNMRALVWWVILIWTIVFWSFVFRLVGLI